MRQLSSRAVATTVATVLATAVLQANAAAAGGPTKIFTLPGNAVLNCPSQHQCTAGGENGQVTTFDPTAPGHPTPVQLVTSKNSSTGNGSIGAIACPSLLQCTALAQGGPGANLNALTFNPKAPGNSTPITFTGGNNFRGLACTSSTLCVAAGATYPGEVPELTPFNPTVSGSAASLMLTGTTDLESIACPSPSQCTAVGGRSSDGTTTGIEVTFNPSAPGSPTPVTVAPGIGLSSVACPTTTLCSAVGRAAAPPRLATVATFNPTAPTGAKLASLGNASVFSISCPSVSQCTAVLDVGTGSNGGSEATFDPSAPGTPTPVRLGDGANSWGSVSCPSLTQCTAVGIPSHGPAQEITFNPRGASGGGASGWSRARCKRAYGAWTRQHKHATRAEKKAEVRALHKQHGCPASLA